MNTIKAYASPDAHKSTAPPTTTPGRQHPRHRGGHGPLRANARRQPRSVVQGCAPVPTTWLTQVPTRHGRWRPGLPRLRLCVGSARPITPGEPQRLAPSQPHAGLDAWDALASGGMDDDIEIPALPAQAGDGRKQGHATASGFWLPPRSSAREQRVVRFCAAG